MPNYEFTPRQQEEIEPSVENDHEKKNSLRPLRSPEEIAADKLKNMLGSSVLALINFQKKKSSKEDKQAVVTPYYEKLSYRIKKEEALAKQEAKITGEPARKIEKIPGENPKEKKIYAYLERLNNTIAKYGSKVEKKIWDESVRRAELIVKKENISAKSWRLLEEEFHESNKNANRPPAVFDEEAKQKKYEEIVSLQKQGLDKWFNYLSTPDTPEDAEEGEPDRPRYPTWFKVYVFDAISKMSSVFKEDEGKYATRAKDTISYFPDLDAGALALTFDALNDFFGKDEEALSSKYDNDEKLLSLVKSGNFNHIYSKFKQDSIEDIKTPEKAEQVRGVWDTYGPGDEEEISKVSQGTPWCIRSPEAAKNYLKTNQQIKNNQAKFVLFRQEKDHATGETYKTASASIRLDTMGRVAEVSGMLDGQGIEDSLVSIVEQEARKYPFNPDKHFEEKFRDKKKLIELWKKSEKNENLTKEEIEFLYEKDKSIWSLDTYNGQDPKITQLRDFYDLKYILSQGAELSQEYLKLIAEKSTAESILNNFEELKNGGVPLETLARHMWGEGIMDHFDEFIDGKVPIETLLDSMGSSTIFKHFEKLKSSGASLEALASRMWNEDIIEHFDEFIKGRVSIDILLGRMGSSTIFKHFEKLKSSVPLEVLVNYIWGEDIVEHFDEFIDGKVPINMLLDHMDSFIISKHFEKLKSSGASLEALARHMRAKDIMDHFDDFIKGGISIETLLGRMDSSIIVKHFEKLKSSVPLEALASHMKNEDIIKHLDEFIDGKVPIDILLNRIDSSTISKHFEKLKSSGASLETLARHMRDEDIIEYFDDFIKGGVSIYILLNRMDSSTIFKHFDKLKNSVSLKVLLVHTSDRIKTSLKNMNPVLFIKNLLQKR